MFRLSKLLAALMISSAAITAVPTDVHAQEKKAIDYADYRPLDLENTLLMTIETNGRVGTAVIELAPWFAPLNVTQMKQLARAEFFDGLDFYRVIENFVAQGGDYSETKKLPEGTGTLLAELEKPIDDIRYPFTPAENPDYFTAETGFIHGFAAAKNPETGSSWLVHCAGVMAMARNTDINTASTEFYFPIGQAPRHLDRNLTIVGRVVDGFDNIQGALRDEIGGDGIIADPKDRSKILSVRVAADVPKEEQPTFKVMKTSSDSFKKSMEGRRNRTSDFWHVKPPVKLDVCTATVPTVPAK